MSVIISNTTATKTNIPFLDIKNEILGKDYKLSLSLVGEKRARQINQNSRNKDYVPNVLSFPLAKKVGEIYLTPAMAKKEAATLNHAFKKHLTFLYIHGLLHLRGLDHGTKMESLEKKYLAKYA